MGYLSFLIADHFLKLSINRLVNILILIGVLFLIIALFIWFLIIKKKWQKNINDFLQDALVNNKFVYPLIESKMVNFETIKIKQEEDQINHYFSKLTYIIIVYFIIIFDAFFIYFLSFIIGLSFNEPFATALISACCSILALFFATYFTQFYQQWKNKINDFQKQHQAFYQQVITFNRFLLFSDLDKISFNKDRLFIDYHFFPNYILQWMNNVNCKNNKVILINELIMWRKYLNNLEHLNTLSWTKCLRILIEYQFNLSKTMEKQILADINTIEKEIFIFF